jgi:CDP-glucose 4,6-dehydratase
MGAKVTGYALDPCTNPNLYGALGADKLVHCSHIADIRDLSELHKAMTAAQPELVIHMAAQPLVRYSYQHPVETFETNIMGTVNLLEAVRLTPAVKAVVNVTTDKCYENKEWIWAYRENEPLGGYDPYSSSKACSELVTQAYRQSFFKPDNNPSNKNACLASARAGNVFGGGDWSEDRLVPDLLSAFAKSSPVAIRNPNAIRPWQHVLEPLRGYLTLAEALCESGHLHAQAYNFGPNEADAKSVGWIATKMAELWGSGAQWIFQKSDQLHEAHYLKLDISKAQSQLNWRPILNLESALQLTVEWEKRRLNGEDAKLITIEQIEHYQALIADSITATSI